MKNAKKRKKLFAVGFLLLLMPFAVAFSSLITTFSNNLNAENITINPDTLLQRNLFLPRYSNISLINFSVRSDDNDSVEIFSNDLSLLNTSAINFSQGSNNLTFYLDFDGDPTIDKINGVVFNGSGLISSGGIIQERLYLNQLNTSSTLHYNMTSGQIKTTGNYSLVFWFNSTDLTFAGQTVNYIFDTRQSDGLYGHLSNPSGTGLIVSDGTKTATFSNVFVETESWTMYSLVINESHSSIWRNTTLIDTSTNVLDPINTVRLTIGARYNLGGSQFFNGSLDEFSIWNKSLSASDIQSLYSDTLLGIKPFGFSNVNVQDHSAYINSILEDGCSCTDCVLKTYYCGIPYYFNSTQGASIEYFNLLANWSYDITNNTNTYQTKAINFSYLDESTETAITVNTTVEINGTIDGSNYTIFTFSEKNKKSTQIFINPKYSEITANYQVQSDNDPTYPERRFTVTSTTLNDNLQEVNFYLLKLSTGIYVRFRTIDNNDNPIVGATARMRKTIDGQLVTIESDITDGSGLVTFFADPNTDYTFDFSKTGFGTVTTVIRPTSSEIYNIVMGGSSPGTAINYSYYTGLKYDFSPDGIVLNNDTRYNFTFNITSSYWNITDCYIEIKDENFTGITSDQGTFSSTLCQANVNYTTTNLSILRVLGLVEINEIVNLTFDPAYRVQETYQGEASLKTFLDDLKGFQGAGFSTFTLMTIAFLIIIVATGAISAFAGIQNIDGVIILFVSLVWLFSYIGWLTFNYPTVPSFFGLQQYLIAYVLSLMGGAFIIQRNYPG